MMRVTVFPLLYGSISYAPVKFVLINLVRVTSLSSHSISLFVFYRPAFGAIFQIFL